MFKKIFAVILVSAIVLTACAAPAPTPAPPTAAPTTAPAATATRVSPTATPLVAIKMKVAYSSANPDPAAAWVAQEAGIFKKNGIEAELSFISGGGNVARALVSGDLQIGVLAPSNIVEATAGGADLVAIAGLVNVMNYDFIVQKGITKAEDLRGKVGAVSSATGSAATALRYTLREFYKLDADKDIAGLRVIGSEPDRVAALAAKQIDFTVVNPDITPDAVKAGAVVLVSLWQSGIPYQHTGVGTSRKYIKENPEGVRRFIKSIVEATAFAKDPKNKSTVIAIIAKYLQKDPVKDKEFLENGYDRMTTKIMQPAPYVTLDGMKTVLGESKQATDKGMKVEDFVDNSFVKELDDNGFVKSLYAK